MPTESFKCGRYACLTSQHFCLCTGRHSQAVLGDVQVLLWAWGRAEQRLGHQGASGPPPAVATFRHSSPVSVRPATLRLPHIEEASEASGTLQGSARSSQNANPEMPAGLAAAQNWQDTGKDAWMSNSQESSWPGWETVQNDGTSHFRESSSSGCAESATGPHGGKCSTPRCSGGPTSNVAAIPGAAAEPIAPSLSHDRQPSSHDRLPSALSRAYGDLAACLGAVAEPSSEPGSQGGLPLAAVDPGAVLRLGLVPLQRGARLGTAADEAAQLRELWARVTQGVSA